MVVVSSMLVRSNRIKSMCGAVYLAISFLVLSSGFFISFNLSADPAFQFHTLDKQQGLVSSVVYDIAQDKDGFMWFATEDGLQKYDGFEFTSYRHSRLDDRSISSNVVRTLLVDSTGRIWAGTNNGLNLYQKKYDNFVRFNSDEKDAQSIGSDQILDIYQTKDNTIWIGGAKGLSKWDENTKSFKNYSVNNVRSIFEDERHQIWIGTLDRGLYIFDRNLKSFERPAALGSGSSYFEQVGILDIFQDSYGRILIATWGSGVFHIDQGQILLKKSELNLPSEFVKTIHQDEAGKIWYGTLEGILIRDKVRSTDRTITTDDSASIAPKSNKIFKIFQGQDKTIWVGTHGGGISRHYPSSRRFESYGVKKNPQDGLIDPVIFAMKEQDDGLVWLGSELGVLSKFNPFTQQFKHYEMLLDGKLFEGQISAIHILNPKKLLIGSQFGLFRYDIESKVLSRFLDQKGNHLRDGEAVKYIQEDRVGTVWIAFRSSGLQGLNRNTQGELGIIHSLSLNIALPSVIENISDKEFLVGTRNNGVYRVIRGEKDFDIVLIPHTERLNVISLELDWLGQLWIATWSKGIKIVATSGEILNIDEDNGLPNNTVYSILADRNSDLLWATTNAGMVSISPSKFHVTGYGFYDGLQGDEFNRPGFKSKTGYLYFGGINGFNRFLPNLIDQHLEIEKPIVTDLRVANELVEVSLDGSTILPESITVTSEISLKFDQTPFSIGFTSPQFVKPTDVEFRYRLLGLDDRWVKSHGGARRATYTNIYAGRYVFELQARNRHQEWNELMVRKTILVQPPWWLATFAKIIYFLLITSILSFMFYLNWKRRQSDHQTHLTREKSEERLRLSLWGGGNEIWDWDIRTGKISRSDEDSSINIKSEAISEGLVELNSYIHKFDIERVKAQLSDHLKGRTEYFESTYRIKDNELGWRWIQDRAKVVERDINGSPIRMSGTQKDVSEIQRKNEEIERLGQAFKNTSDGVWIRDSKWRLIEVNPSYEKITGFNFDEKQGEELWFPDVEGQSANIIQRIRLSLMEKGHWQGEVWAERKKDEPFPQKLTIDTILDEKGHVNYYVGVFSDITFHKRAEQEFRKLANFDALTGLPNRACLYDRLNQTLEKTRIRKERFALFIVDIDNFKRINDSMGHTVGDTLIAEVAQRLTHCNRDGDTIARVGGDEFVIIRDDISSSSEVASFAELMLKELNSPIFAKGQKLSLNFSIGITLSPDDGTTAEKLLRNADTAMYEAKKEVQNSYHFFSVDLNKKARKRLSMENELRRAIEFDLIELAYQPKVNMETGLVDGMEALARWNSPKLGQIPPDEFIVVAEETGQIITLGAQLLKKAIAQTKRWVKGGLMKGRMSVNLSAHQFLHDDLPEQVETILREEGLDAKYLELELTESACIEDIDKTIRQMNALRKLGIHLALDDFGTGYSSLAQLKTLPLDTLKVDKSFIENIQTSSRDVNVVKAIIDIARSLDLGVVIEGVESQSQCDYLWQCRAKIIQGYYFSKPVTSEKMTALLNKKWKRSSYLTKVADNVTSLG